MVIIYGTRPYGDVEHCHGEYAATRFFHLYWMPLFPVSSTMWVQQHDDDHFRGHRMRWSWKSLAAAYLRTWGLLLGCVILIPGLLAFSGELARIPAYVASLLLGASLVGAAAYSWTWRRLSPEQQHRRAMFASVVGTHCDPELLPDDMVLSLRQSIDKLWEERFSTQTPNDVARFGAKEPAQAALAYSLLRLLAREVEPAKEQGLLDLAETIANGIPQEQPSQENPYRTDAVNAFVQEEKQS
jgi:hypothetical protein